MSDNPELLEVGESGGSGHAQPTTEPALAQSGGSGDVHGVHLDPGFEAVFPAFADSAEFGDVGGAPGEPPAQANTGSEPSHGSRNPTRGDIGGDDELGGNEEDVVEEVIEVTLSGLRGDVGGAAGSQEPMVEETSATEATPIAEAWARSACGGSGGSGAFEAEAPPEITNAWSRSACGGSGGSGTFQAAAGSGGAPDREPLGGSPGAPGTGSMQGPAQSEPPATPEPLVGDVGGDHGPVWAAHITGGGSGGIVDSDDQEERSMDFTCGLGWSNIDDADQPSPGRLGITAPSAQPSSAAGDVGPMPAGWCGQARPPSEEEEAPGGPPMASAAASDGYPAPRRGVAEDFDSANSIPASPEDSPDRRAVQEAASSLGLLDEAAAPAGESGASSAPSGKPEPFTFDDDEVKEQAAGTAGESGACSSPSGRNATFTFGDEQELIEESADEPEVFAVGTTGESGACSSLPARAEPFGFDDDEMEAEEAPPGKVAGTAGESGACSSPSPRPEAFSFSFEDEAQDKAPGFPLAETAAGTAGETGACSSPSTRPAPFTFDEEDEEKDEASAAADPGATSPPEPFAFAFDEEAASVPALGIASGDPMEAAELQAEPEPLPTTQPEAFFAFDDEDAVQEEVAAATPPARQTPLSFDSDTEEAQELPLRDECSPVAEPSTQEAEQQPEAPANSSPVQSPLAFDDEDDEDREEAADSAEAPSPVALRPSPLAFEDAEDHQAAPLAEEARQEDPLSFDEEDSDQAPPPVVETERQSALAFDDEEDDMPELQVPEPATVASETARQSPLTFDDEDEAEDEKQAPGPGDIARPSSFTFEEEEEKQQEEAPPPAEAEPRQVPLSFGDEDEDDDEVPEASPQTSRPWASAQSSAPPAYDDDDDDDQFADFASAESPPTTSQPSAPGAGKDEEDEDENWAFTTAPAFPEPSAASLEELASSVEQLLSQWKDAAKSASIGFPAAFLEEAGGAGEQEVPAFDDWIRSAVHMPEEAAPLIQNGVSATNVPSLPFSLFGAPAFPETGSLGSVVRDNFFAALGKHLQLPSTKPEALSSPQASHPSSPQTLSGVTAVPAQESQVSAVPPVTVAGDEAMADMDFGFFEVSAPPKVPSSQAAVSSGPLEADVLAQALSSVGLQNAPTAASTATSAALPSPDAAGAPQAKKKKKGMTQKVKNWLSGLPDLKHLYSKSVVE